MNLLLATAMAAGFVLAPEPVTYTQEQVEAMAVAPIDAAPLIAMNVLTTACQQKWVDYYNCRMSGYPDCREPNCDTVDR